MHGFVNVVPCVSRPLPNKTKLKFDQEFKAHWSFCSDLKVLIESKYSMPWVRCAFGNVLWSILGGGCIEIQHQELLRLFWCRKAFLLNNLSLTNGRLGQQQTCASTYTRRGGPPSGRTAPQPAAGTWKYYFRQNLLQLDKGQICRKRPQIFCQWFQRDETMHEVSFALCTFMKWCVPLLPMVLIMNWSKSIDCVTKSLSNVSYLQSTVIEIDTILTLTTKYATRSITMPGASMTKHSSHQYRKRVLALNVFREKFIYPPSFCTIEPVNLSQYDSSVLPVLGVFLWATRTKPFYAFK